MRPERGVAGAHPSQPAAAVTLRTSCACEVLRAEDAQDPGRHTATVRRGRPTAASHRPGKDNSVQVYLLDWQHQGVAQTLGVSLAGPAPVQAGGTRSILHIRTRTYKPRVQSERVQQEAWLRPQITSQGDQTDQDRAWPAARTLRVPGLLPHASELQEPRQ